MRGGVNAPTQFALLTLCVIGTFTISPWYVVPAALCAFLLGCYAMSSERH